MENVTEKALDLINQGCALMAQGKYEFALEKFQTAQEDSPKYIECYTNLGNALSCLERYDEALENFKKGLMLDEKSAIINFDIGNIMYLKGDIAEAIKYYNRADECGTLSADMYDVMAELFIETQDYTQGLRFINRAIKIEPLNGEYYLEKVRIFIEQEKVDEALETLSELNKLLPDVYDAYDMMSEIYTIKQDFNKAMEIVEKGIEKFPEDENMAYLKFRVLCKFEKDEEAIKQLEELREANRIKVRKEDFALLESDIYLREKNIEKAILSLENVSDENYSNSQIAFVLATMYLKLERFDKVISITEKVMQNDDDLFSNSSAKFYHAQAMLHSGKQDEATKEFKAITKEFRKLTILNPGFYEGYTYRLLAHKELKEYEEALDIAEYMKNLFSDRPDGYVFKYIIYKDMGKLDEAEEEKKKALDIDPAFVF